jgi:hypothetical protein
VAKQRPPRLRHRPPRLTIGQILAWTDWEHEQTGRWPQCKDQHVLANPNEKWANIDALLRTGGRGLPRGYGYSLPRLLAEYRGVRNIGDLPELTSTQIKAWAEAHYKATGQWPHSQSGPIPGTLGESWESVERALREGTRGLPGGDTVAEFMAWHFGARNKAGLPPLTRKQILAWADAYRQRTGHWPRVLSGPIPEAPGETWQIVDNGLREGLRGLEGGSSLAQLLAKCRKARNKAQTPPLTIEQILAWADAHHQRTGCWPTQTSGPVVGAAGETWGAIHRSLVVGQRGLPGGDTLVKLLQRTGRRP